MRWSIRLGRYAGIDVYLHVTFVLFLLFMAAAHGVAEGTVGAAVRGGGFFAAVFACVLLHEFGHALAARRFGIRTRDITLLPIGGVARLERMPERPIQELWVALAGPAVNVAIAAVLLLWLAVSSQALSLAGVEIARGSFAMRLLVVNVMLVLFNMVPAFPMDGGRVLRALLAMRMDYAKATRIAATLGQGIALVFAALGLLGLFGGNGNPLLLFIALFVWIGASQESGAVQFRSALGGARVDEAMLPDFVTLRPDESLGRAVDLILAGSQEDFPVLDQSGVVGILTRQRLLAGLSSGGKEVAVGSVMEREFRVVRAGDALEGVMASESGHPPRIVPVVSGSALVGLLTWDNVTDFILIRNALGTGRPRAGRIPPVLAH